MLTLPYGHKLKLGENDMKTNRKGTLPGAWRVTAAAALALSMLGTGLTASAAPTTRCTVNVNQTRSSTIDATATLTGSTSGCEAGKLVASAKSNGRWTTVGSTEVKGDGAFTVALTGLATRPGRYDVRVELENTTSRTVRVERVAKPTINTGEWSLVGTTANAWGRVEGMPWAEVWTEVLLENGRWSRSQTRKSNAGGGYVIPLSYGVNTPGTYKYRVAVRSLDGTILRSKSHNVVRVARPTVNTAGSALVGVKSNAWGTFPKASRARVWTEVRLPNGTWSQSRSGTTNTSGGYTLPLTYGANSAGSYAYRVAAKYPNGDVVRTGTAWLKRLGKPTINTAGGAPANQKSNAWGQFQGGAGITVWTEVKLPNGTWSTSRTGKAKSNGSYVLPLTYGSSKPGSYTFRVAGRYPNGTIARSQAVRFNRTNPQYNLDSRCYSGARVMCASKKDRKLYYVMDGKVVKVLDARFGSKRLPTRNGVHHVYRKSRHHVSGIYGTAMPWAMFFDGGQAVHYSSNFARVGWNHPGSGGCINIRDSKTLDWIYKQTRIGDKVVVY